MSTVPGTCSPTLPGMPRDREAHLAGLRAIAWAARRFLEPLWLTHTLRDEWSCIDPPLSRGTCRVSSEFLAGVMADAGHPGWSVHGGQRGYARDGGERWPHYWLSDGMDVIDLTGDQFGEPAVLVGTADRRRYVAGAADPGEPGALDPLAREWHALWRERAGVPFDSHMSAAAMDRFLGPSSAALALMLRDYLGGEPARIGGPSGPVVLLVDGTVYDASGMADLPRFAYLRDIPAEAVTVLGAGEADALGAVTPPAELADAGRFASAHPALVNAVMQARQAGRECPDEREGIGAGGSPGRSGP